MSFLCLDTSKILIVRLICKLSFIFFEKIAQIRYKSKEHWNTNGADEIEGIYEDTDPNPPKYKMAVLKQIIILL
jgi:hypothetical protein